MFCITQDIFCFACYTLISSDHKQFNRSHFALYLFIYNSYHNINQSHSRFDINNQKEHWYAKKYQYELDEYVYLYLYWILSLIK